MRDYTAQSAHGRQVFDAGLRSYMIKIYNYMSLALILTGVTAFATLSFEPFTRLMFEFTPSGRFIGNTGFGTLMMFSPLGVFFYFYFNASSMNVEKSKIFLFVYAALTGISLSSLGFVYTGESIARTFFISSGTFAGMSIYGYSTKRNLTSFGSFLIMGLIGLLITSIINMFLQSSMIHFITSIIGVGIFMGLIAWDTQKLKDMYYAHGGDEERGSRAAVMGAFTLYLDFINLFIYLLRFFGVRQDD